MGRRIIVPGMDIGLFRRMNLSSYTKLLCHFENPTFGAVPSDSSASGHSLTNTDPPPVLTVGHDDTHVKFGSYSLFNAGATFYITAPDSADWYFGTAAFSIDFWIYLGSLPDDGQTRGFIGQSTDANNYWGAYIYNSGGTQYIQFDAKTSGTQIEDTHGVWYGADAEAWTHVAIIRGWGGAATEMAITVNGVPITTSTVADFNLADLTGTLDISCAKIGASTHVYAGWMDEVRVVKGRAMWTNNFLVPDGAYV